MTLQNNDDEDVFWEKGDVSAKSAELKSPFTPKMVAETYISSYKYLTLTYIPDVTIPEV